MNVRCIRLIAGSREDLLKGYLDDLHYLRERRGEKIAAVDEASGTLLGTIGVYPDRDEGGPFFHLSGIEVAPGGRAAGIDALLMEEAEKLIRERAVTRLKFGTSPLVAANAELYITRFGTRYRWREGTKTPDGRPWPHVSCECDFDDPLARPLDLRDEEVAARSVLDWLGPKPIPRPRVVYSGPLSVLLPDLSGDDVAEIAERDPSFLPTLYSVFHALFIHGYGFAWFDRLPAQAASPGSPRGYYVMSRILAF